MPELRECSDEKKKLKDLIKRAWPNASAGTVKNKMDEYWKIICFNPQQHSKKLIIIEKYDEITNGLHSRIMAEEGKYKLMWGKLKTVPANTPISRPSFKNSNVNNKKRDRSDDDVQILRPKKKRRTSESWRQNQVQHQINNIEAEIDEYEKKKEKQFVDPKQIDKAIQEKQKEIDKLKKKKKRLESNRKSQQKRRAKAKKMLRCHPNAAETAKPNDNNSNSSSNPSHSLPNNNINDDMESAGFNNGDFLISDSRLHDVLDSVQNENIKNVHEHQLQPVHGWSIYEELIETQQNFDAVENAENE